MPIKVIGKSVLGELGFCQVPSKMGDKFESQFKKISNNIFSCSDAKIKRIAMTSMTGSTEINLNNGDYVPKIRLYDKDLALMFDPYQIYHYCELGLDSVRPGADFIIWNSEKDYSLCVTTFSREAPILAFESDNGMKCIGVILRPALMKHRDYLFDTISKCMGGKITVTLVTCNHYKYKNRYDEDISIPTIIQNLALKYKMNCMVAINSEEDPDCYHRGESGNHVVAMW